LLEALMGSTYKRIDIPTHDASYRNSGPGDSWTRSTCGYSQTKSGLSQNVGFDPESGNRPVENRLIC